MSGEGDPGSKLHRKLPFLFGCIEPPRSLITCSQQTRRCSLRHHQINAANGTQVDRKILDIPMQRMFLSFQALVLPPVTDNSLLRTVFRLDNLMSRFEEPSSSARWDSPLITVASDDIPVDSTSSEDGGEGRKFVSKQAEEIWQALANSELKPPNLATQVVEFSSFRLDPANLVLTVHLSHHLGSNIFHFIPYDPRVDNFKCRYCRHFRPITLPSLRSNSAPPLVNIFLCRSRTPNHNRLAETGQYATVAEVKAAVCYDEQRRWRGDGAGTRTGCRPVREVPRVSTEMIGIHCVVFQICTIPAGADPCDSGNLRAASNVFRSAKLTLEPSILRLQTVMCEYR